MRFPTAALVSAFRMRHSIGSVDPTKRDTNVIAGNAGDGIIIQRGPIFMADQNVLQGNHIGVDRAGQVAIGNGGIGINLMGATGTAILSNTIGGNGAGVAMALQTTYDNVLKGNFIGTDATGTLEFGNGEHGVYINSLAHNNIVGGIGPGEGNVIAKHSGRGVWMTSVGTNGNALRGNSIYDNQGDEVEAKLGIDLTPSGPNPNDLGDPDDGPNKLQNYPEPVAAYNFAGETILAGFPQQYGQYELRHRHLLQRRARHVRLR